VVDGVLVQAKPFVPYNLDSLRRHLSDMTEARSVLEANLHARQRHLEASVFDLAVEMLERRSQTMEQRGLPTGRLFHAELQHLMWKWHLALQKRIRVEITRIINDEKPEHLSPIGPFLALVRPEKLSLLTILEIMRLQGSGGVIQGMKMTRALIAVGKAVENEYKVEMCKSHDIPVPQFFGRRGDGVFSTFGYNHLHQRRVAAAATHEDGEEWTAAWTQVARAKVGAVLVECLMDVAQIERTSVNRETGETMYVWSFPWPKIDRLAQLFFGQNRITTCVL
jgi:DNA-directed RNA polymerase, mitochondrial